MLYEIITWLIGAIGFSIVLQKSAQRFYAVAVFALAILGHELLLYDLDGLAYYGSAASFDLTVIILLSGINPVCKTVYRLQVLSVISIVTNAAGWLIWFLYLPPIAYEVAYIGIYSAALYVALSGGDHVGNYRLDSWVNCVRGFRRARSLLFVESKGKT